MIKFSVITPAYNAESTILRCINSVRNTCFDNYEHIIVNDGSSDRTSSICEEERKKDSHIFFVSKQNGGPLSARLKGIDICTGQYIVFLDADDELTANSLLILYKAIENNHMPDCVVFRLRNIEKAKNEIDPRHKIIEPKKIEGNRGVIEEMFLKNLYWYMCEKTFKAEILKNTSINSIFLNYRLSEDTYHSYCALKKCNSLLLIPDDIYIYHRSNNSLTGTIDVDKKRQSYLVYKTIYSDIINATIFEETSENNWYFYFLSSLLYYFAAIKANYKNKKRQFLAERKLPLMEKALRYKKGAKTYNVFVYLFKKKHFLLLSIYLSFMRAIKKA